MVWHTRLKDVFSTLCRSAAVRPKERTDPTVTLRPNWLTWPIERLTQTFRVYVVEPQEYNPRQHGGIFNAALTSLISPTRSRLDPFVAERTPEIIESFDLITFPEAFLPMDELLPVLQHVSALESLGCVHVGLRPSTNPDQHLFKVQELRHLVRRLNHLRRIHREDLTPFSGWLNSQSEDNRFNVGCLFTIDAQKYLRVCLHPKLVRSKYEASPLQENHMTEANLLTLVTLQPKNWALLSVTLQPLLCADALFIDTDRPQCRPLEAVTAHSACFKKPPPDHIDIVSVATCTFQPEPVASNGVHYRQWHQQFRNSFVRAASDAALPRHHYSIFVISNFGMIEMGTRAAGGLSGAFLPIPFRYDKYPPFVTVSVWGRTSSDHDNDWSQPAKDPPRRSSLGYIASLDPFAGSSPTLARMLGFTINRLPRATTYWSSTNGLTNFQLRTAAFDNESGKVVFVKEGSNV